MPDVELIQLLNRLESSAEPLEEWTIYTEILRIRPEIAHHIIHPDFFEASAEALAFAICEPLDESDREGLFLNFRENGAWAAVAQDQQRVLQYWAERAGATAHPVLRARYAGLVRELENPPSVEMARAYIDAAVAMSQASCHKYEGDVMFRLEYGLGLAIRINDGARIDAVRNAIIGFEKQIGDDGAIGTWGRAFDLLCENKKSRITDEQRRNLIVDLEDRLERISNPAVEGGGLDPHGSEAAARRLARYYRKAEQLGDVERVLIKVGRAFEAFAATADPLLAQAWFADVERLYREFGLIENASRLRTKIRDLGPSAVRRLVPFRQEIEIKQEDIDRYVSNIVEGNDDTVVAQFIIYHIPRRRKTEKRLKKISSKTPEMLVGHQTIVDPAGRPVVSLGSLESDIDGHIMIHTKREIGFVSIYMRAVIEAMISRRIIDTEKVLARVDGSPLFDSSKRPIIEQALKFYFDKKPMLFLHLAIPQIESAVRKLAELLGVDTYRPNRVGGMDLRSMDDLLREQTVVETLKSDVTDYFRMLYTDKRGINLRNDLCHGMLPTETFGIGLADRVFHTLLLLTLIKAAPNEGSHAGSETTDRSRIVSSGEQK